MKLRREESSKKVQRIDYDIEAQKLVFKLAGQKKWLEVKQFWIENDMLTQQELDLMDIACVIPNKMLSEKQSLMIINTFHDLEEIGFVAN